MLTNVSAAITDSSLPPALSLDLNLSLRRKGRLGALGLYE